MRAAAGIVLAVAALSAVPQPAADSRASIANARIEIIPGVAPADALERAGRGTAPEWVGWSVPAIPAARDICCFSDDFRRRACSLADRDSSWGSREEPTRDEPADLYVLVETTRGRPSKVRLVSPSCPVEGAGRRLLWLGAVDPAASLAVLGRLVEDRERDDGVAEHALAAVAHHADLRADALIERRALDRSVGSEGRTQALFWAGKARGEAGYELLDRVLGSEPDGELREQAVFALSQSSRAQAIDRIQRAAIEDRDGDVRGHALFCLAQSGAPGAGEWILGRLDAERDPEVREQAVFALSQLDDATDWLLTVLRSKRAPEIIRRALFWLGQSDDPRALAEIEKILR